jgi:hypothetical protein
MDIQKLCIWTPACVRGAMEWALEFRFQKEACSWLKAFAVRPWDPAGNRPVSLPAGCGGGSACGLGTAGVDERGTVDSLSEAQLGAADASLIKHLLDHGPVTIEFSFSDRIRKDVKVPNVTAEIPEGRRRTRWRSWMRTWIHGSRGRARGITEPVRPA